MNPHFQGNETASSTAYEAVPMATFSPDDGPDPDVYHTSYHSGYNPVYNPPNNPQFNPQYHTQYNPQYNTSYDPNYDRGYNTKQPPVSNGGKPKSRGGIKQIWRIWWPELLCLFLVISALA